MLVSGLENPAITLIKLSASIALPRILREAARIQLGHFLKDQPRTLEEIAERYDYQPHVVELLMDVLVANDIVTTADNRYVGTTLTDSLDVVDQLFVGIEGWHCWGALDKCLATGQSVFPQLYGADFFSYLQQHPQQNANWKKWNTVSSGEWMTDIARTLDIADNESLCDIGGGEGELLQTILETHPNCRGLLFDRKEVVPDTSSLFQIESGDMFSNVPSGMDNYLLSRVFCNWNDEQSLLLLHNIRRAMHKDSKLFVIDGIMPPKGHPERADLAANSLSLLLIFGARIRTHSEFSHLFNSAGFTQINQFETPNPNGIDFSLMILQGS